MARKGASRILLALLSRYFDSEEIMIQIVIILQNLSKKGNFPPNFFSKFSYKNKNLSTFITETIIF